MQLSKLAHAFAQWAKTSIGAFRYLPTYIGAAAKQWNAILFGEGMLGIFFLVWWALGSPPLIVIFVTASLVAGFLVWYGEYAKNIPLIEASRCLMRKREIRSASLSGLGPKSGEGLYVQIAPKCLTGKAIENCRAILIRIVRRDGSNWVETGVNEPTNLPWASQASDEPSITLEPRAESPVNVFHTERLGLRIYPASTALPFNIKLDVPGQFNFDLKFTAPGCADLYRSLEVKVGQTWDDVSCDLWEGLSEDGERRTLLCSISAADSLGS
jgi:hypothetical protein